MTSAELGKRIQNTIVIGTVVETQSTDGKMLVKVEYEDDCTSDFLPVLGKSNSFMKVWMPLMAGEQVLVLHPMGDMQSGIVMPSIFNTNSKEPTGASDTTAIVEFNDGCVIKYDTSSKELSVNSCSSIAFDCDKMTISGTLDVDGDITSGGSITDSDGNGGA